MQKVAFDKLDRPAAIMGTPGGFAPPFGPPPTTSSPLASLGLANPPAMVRRRRSWRAPHATRLHGRFALYGEAHRVDVLL